MPDSLASGLSVLEFGDLTYSGAFLLETLPVTPFIVERHGNDPDRAIRAAVNHTRDNDTIASLVASAIGVKHGMDAFRPDWVTGLLGRTGGTGAGSGRAGRGGLVSLGELTRRRGHRRLGSRPARVATRGAYRSRWVSQHLR